MSSMYADLGRPPLSAETLRRALVTPGSLWTDVEVVAEAESTNALLAQRAVSGAGSGLVLIAEHQTAGRGRLDRTWTAPPRSGLTMSALVRPHDVEVTQWPWLPLLAGLAVAAAVRREARLPAKVKWPNDVLVGDRKLAGVLVGRVEAGDLPPAAVIGMGLNVSQRESELPAPSATSLLVEDAATGDRSLLARAILRALQGLVTTWQLHGGGTGSELHAAYVDACATVGQRVSVQVCAGEPIRGTAVGVDGGGRLLVQTHDGQVALAAGDVMHVRPQT
ncbi:MAG: biotin--[acetyl-CoA-carboxylase] ligase [Nocardioidaceae bacterium]|nr:biotin--[acetyl-CoA-carboxylase] ligase [Nocardioidaceae bacterium]